MIQETSLEAYESIKDTLGKRQQQVYDCLKEIQPATNLMISKKLGLPINSVTPRVQELRNMKKVGVSSVKKDLNTKRTSIYWKIVINVHV